MRNIVGTQYCGGGGSSSSRRRISGIVSAGTPRRTGRRGAVEGVASAFRQYGTRVGGPAGRRGGPQGGRIGAIARGA